MVLLALISAAFGMIEGREDALSNRAETHEYDALSRMTRWRATNGSTVEHDRTFVYDGSSRLVRITDAVSSDVTNLHQDVDEGHRWTTHANGQSERCHV